MPSSNELSGSRTQGRGTRLIVFFAGKKYVSLRRRRTRLMMSMNAWGEDSDSGENVSIDAVTLPLQMGIGSRQREALSGDDPDGRTRSPV